MFSAWWQQQKYKESQFNLFLTFIDLTKAFDTVCWKSRFGGSRASMALQTGSFGVSISQWYAGTYFCGVYCGDITLFPSLASWCLFYHEDSCVRYESPIVFIQYIKRRKSILSCPSGLYATFFFFFIRLMRIQANSIDQCVLTQCSFHCHAQWCMPWWQPWHRHQILNGFNLHRHQAETKVNIDKLCDLWLADD